MLWTHWLASTYLANIEDCIFGAEYNIPYFEDATIRIVDEEALASESTIRKLRPKNKEYYTRHQNEAFNNCYIIQR